MIRAMKKDWFKGVSTADIISLGMLEPIGPIAWQKIYRSFESGRELLKASPTGLAKLGLAKAQINALIDRSKNVEAAERLLASKKIELITLDNPNYPTLLKEINDPPLWLYLRGDITQTDKKLLTIVGTRKPSAYALAALEKVVSEKLAKEVGLVSGLAYGIDKAVHERALKAGGLTIAVLAGGLDSIYPIDHSRLAEQIVASGGVLISEYPPLCRPRPWRFPVRNRILAGLAPATLVVEAKIKSGSLTTAKSAIDYNRDLFAVPGDINRGQAEGTNFLIKRGAMLLDESDELERYFGLTKSKNLVDTIDKELKSFVDLLSDAPLTTDQLVVLSGQPVEAVLAIITQLELLEIVSQDQSGAYRLK